MTQGQFVQFIIIVIVFFLSIVFFFSKKRFNRHKHNQKKATQVLKKISSFEHQGQQIGYLRKIDPFVFEELLLNAFEFKGYKVIRNKKYTGDGGIDGIVFDHHGNKILIQAKRYASYINPQHIATFQLVLQKKKAVKGFFIHTGKTSSSTRDQFRHSNIILIGGSKLLYLIKQPLD